MSKQLKLKFKKLLKKADFIHADLEYHEELVAEAKQLFHEAVQEWFGRLPPEERTRLQAIAAAKERAGRQREQIDEEDDSSEIIDPDQCISLVELEKNLVEETESRPPNIDKEKELKRLFYRIAECTHPDKAGARGAGSEEIKRLEKLFRNASAAHKNRNWYGLYSIASELGLDLGTPRDDHLDWVEEDIREALGAIARIAHLIVWIWYSGDSDTRAAALRSYFLQTYNYDYPA